MKSPRRLLTVSFISMFAVTTLLAIFTMAGVLADATNDQIAPNPANSGPGSHNHVFFMRKDSGWGDNSNLSLKAYYPADINVAEWNAATLKIRPGGQNINDTWVCQKDSGNMGAAALKQYVQVRLNVQGAPEDVWYYIPYSNVCAGGSQDHINEVNEDVDNVFFGTYKLPRLISSLPKADVNTGRIIVNITIKYNGAVPERENNLGNTLRFDIRGNTSGLKIGEKGELQNNDSDAYYSFPLISDATYQTQLNPMTANVPFGLSCDITGDRDARIGLYDADNGSTYWPSTKVSFKVKQKATNDYMRFIDGSERRGSLSDGRTTFTPNNGEGNFASVRGTFKANTKYVLEITGIVPRNIIDIHVPGDTIFGDLGCHGATLVPKATVNGSSSDITKSLGSTLTFENWASTNKVDNVGDSTFDLQVNAQNKLSTIANVGSRTFTLKPEPSDDHKPDNQNPFTITPTEAGKYCRQTVVSNFPAWVDTPQGDRTSVCATLQLGWEFDPNSAINKTAMAANAPPAIWTHTIKNVGSLEAPAGSGTWRVYQQIDGNPATSVRSNITPFIAKNGTYTATGTYSFTATAADVGKIICQWVEVTPYIKNQTTPGARPSDKKCVEVQGATVKNVQLSAFVSGGGETETQTQANFTGGVNVSGMPNVYDANPNGTWGYSELASKVAATRTTATKTQEGLGATLTDYSYACPSFWTPTSPTGPTTCTGTGTTTYSCPWGGTLSGAYCSVSYPATPNYTCPGGGSLSGTTCYKSYPGLTTKKACEGAGHNWSGGCTDSFAATISGYNCSGLQYQGTCYTSYAAASSTTPAPTQPAALTVKYRFYCSETKNWWPSSTTWTTYAVDPCRDYYTCPGTSAAGAAWASNASEVTCKSWQCKYGASPFDTTIYTNAQAPDCEYRCPSTGGARPFLAPNTKNTTGTGELRCFVRPSFTLTCYWDTGVTASEVVDHNGNFCATTTSKMAGNIGPPDVCAVLTPNQPSGWSSPPPGMTYSPSTGTVQATVWRWTISASSGCRKVVGMPYVKVIGGDVRVGGGVSSINTNGDTVCTPNNQATIKTLNRGPSGYEGSGTQYAAIAPGFIDRFVSGQYNAGLAKPDVGDNPKKLSFASNAGGIGYGGGFGNNGGCYDYVQGLPSDTQIDTGDVTINNSDVPPLAAGKKVTRLVKGDIYINTDIKYLVTNWADASKIPLYQLVAQGGDIYIDDGVTQLDGLYSAVQVGTKGGNIYTCAFGLRDKPTTSFSSDPARNCKKQLVVNGAFAAKKISFFRDCGSLIWAQSDGGPVYQGGTDAQQCGPIKHAAEVFNYTPEQWIRGVVGDPSNKYDYISSMPPVL